MKSFQEAYAHAGKVIYGCKLREGHSWQREAHICRNPDYNQAEESLKDIDPCSLVLYILEESHHKKLKSHSV